MTQLTNLSPASSFGDLLTTTNGGAGLSNVLVPLQDGFGNNSSITIALDAISFSRTGGNSFQLDGVALTAPASNINSICGNPPTFPNGQPIILPQWTTGGRPSPASNGMLGYNTSLNQVEAFVNGLWTAL